MLASFHNNINLHDNYSKNFVSSTLNPVTEACTQILSLPAYSYTGCSPHARWLIKYVKGCS